MKEFSPTVKQSACDLFTSESCFSQFFKPTRRRMYSPVQNHYAWTSFAQKIHGTSYLKWSAEKNSLANLVWWNNWLIKSNRDKNLSQDGVIFLAAKITDTIIFLPGLVSHLRLFPLQFIMQQFSSAENCFVRPWSTTSVPSCCLIRWILLENYNLIQFDINCRLNYS